MSYNALKKSTDKRSLSAYSPNSKKKVNRSRGAYIFCYKLLSRGITLFSMMFVFTICGVVGAGAPKDSCYEIGIGLEAVILVLLLLLFS